MHTANICSASHCHVLPSSSLSLSPSLHWCHQPSITVILHFFIAISSLSNASNLQSMSCTVIIVLIFITMRSCHCHASQVPSSLAQVVFIIVSSFTLAVNLPQPLSCAAIMSHCHFHCHRHQSSFTVIHSLLHLQSRVHSNDTII